MEGPAICATRSVKLSLEQRQAADWFKAIIGREHEASALRQSRKDLPCCLTERADKIDAGFVPGCGQGPITPLDLCPSHMRYLVAPSGSKQQEANIRAKHAIPIAPHFAQFIIGQH